MPDDDSKRDQQYYKNPEATNEGLARQIQDRKRGQFAPEKKAAGEFDLNPVAGESLRMDVEQRLEAVRRAEEDPPDKKRTLHDPKKFEELMKERAAASGSQPVQKITGTEIGSLKESAHKKESPAVRLVQLFSATLSHLAAALAGIFFKPKTTTQCDMYGHIAPASGWSGEFPRCTRCGREITSQDQLRSSSARLKAQDIKPYDNRLEL